MVCYNCPNWQPYNPSTVNGFCSVCGSPTRADTECFDPVSSDSEWVQISGIDLFEPKELESLRRILRATPMFETRDVLIKRIGDDALVQVIVRGLFDNEHEERKNEK